MKYTSGLLEFRRNRKMIQCYVFLHVAELDAQQLYKTLQVMEKDNIQALIDSFREYCTGKTITVFRF